MTRTLTVVMLLSTVIATPVFAKSKTHHESFRGAYNQMIEPGAVSSSLTQRNIENFGISGRDASRVGGFDPSLRPSGS
jgi:hypothetical protein